MQFKSITKKRIVSIVLGLIVYLTCVFLLNVPPQLILPLYLLVFFAILFLKNNKPFDLKNVISILFILQLLVAPSITYYILQNAVSYPMLISDKEYFSFVMPGVILFLLGLYLPIRKKYNEQDLLFRLTDDNSNYEKIGFFLLLTSFIAQIIMPYLPTSVRFILILLASFKYIAAFYLFFSKSKFGPVVLIIVFASMAFQIIQGGVFIDFFIWSFFIFKFIAFKWRIPFTFRIIVFVLSFNFAYIIQSFKKEYREVISDTTLDVNEFNVFNNFVFESLGNYHSLFSDENIDKFVSRINQGWILSAVLDEIPKRKPIAEGNYLLEEGIGIVLPRFVYSEKATAGSHEKFEYMTGITLNTSTAMNVGVLGDGYGNFGKFGGLLFVFLFGYSLNFLINKFFHVALKYPSILFWIPVVFFYSMRVGNEFYIIMNWIVKSSVLVLVIFYLFRRYFYSPKS